MGSPIHEIVRIYRQKNVDFNRISIAFLAPPTRKPRRRMFGLKATLVIQIFFKSVLVALTHIVRRYWRRNHTLEPAHCSLTDTFT